MWIPWHISGNKQTAWNIVRICKYQLSLYEFSMIIYIYCNHVYHKRSTSLNTFWKSEKNWTWKFLYTFKRQNIIPSYFKPRGVSSISSTVNHLQSEKLPTDLCLYCRARTANIGALSPFRKSSSTQIVFIPKLFK